MKITYDKKADAAYFYLRKGKIDHTIEIDQNTLIDVNTRGSVMGIEILSVSFRPKLKTYLQSGVAIDITSKKMTGLLK